jgi:ankyrin repeat protein
LHISERGHVRAASFAQAGKTNIKNEAGFFSLRPKGKARPGASKSESPDSIDQMPDFAEKIHNAAKANDLIAIDALRAAHKDNIRRLVEAPDFHGATPLMKVRTSKTRHAQVMSSCEQHLALSYLRLPLPSQAAMYGSTGALDKLLSDGASTTATDMYGRTPLMLAALNGELGILQALLKHGADVSTMDKRCGRNAIMWAIQGGYPDAVRKWPHRTRSGIATLYTVCAC